MIRNEDKLSEVLSYLEVVIEDRKKSKKKSYTSDLLSQGIDRVSQKVGEEAIEVVIASNNKKKKTSYLRKCRFSFSFTSTLEKVKY